MVLNFVLLFFNLIPLGPLDGAAVLAGLLPPSMQRIAELNRKYGMLVLLVLFLSPSMGLPGAGRRHGAAVPTDRRLAEPDRMGVA